MIQHIKNPTFSANTHMRCLIPWEPSGNIMTCLINILNYWEVLYGNGRTRVFITVVIPITRLSPMAEVLVNFLMTITLSIREL